MREEVEVENVHAVLDNVQGRCDGGAGMSDDGAFGLRHGGRYVKVRTLGIGEAVAVLVGLNTIHLGCRDVMVSRIRGKVRL